MSERGRSRRRKVGREEGEGREEKEEEKSERKMQGETIFETCGVFHFKKDIQKGWYAHNKNNVTSSYEIYLEPGSNNDFGLVYLQYLLVSFLAPQLLSFPFLTLSFSSLFSLLFLHSLISLLSLLSPSLPLGRKI